MNPTTATKPLQPDPVITRLVLSDAQLASMTQAEVHEHCDLITKHIEADASAYHEWDKLKRSKLTDGARRGAEKQQKFFRMRYEALCGLRSAYLAATP